MFELLALISIVLAIAALSSARGARARLDTELAAVKLELKRLEGLAGTRPPSVQAQEESDATAEAARPDAIGEHPSAEAVAGLAEQPADALPPGDAESETVIEAPQPIAAAVNAPATPARESLESRLAARWSVWVGGLALAFAGIFAVKYSIDQGLLSPAVRLSLAALFGLVLMAAGEWLRRRSTPLIENTFQNALIPGIVTAAGTLTLMGAVYVAHGIYGFFGPAPAFLLLCLISLATLALSLLHGQALAGLGLLASFVTPLLVTSTAPSPWPLFGFLSVAWIGSTLAARIRQWRVTPAIANAGLSLWALLYVAGSTPFEVAPVALSLLIMIAGLAFLWPGRWQPIAAVVAPAQAEDDATREDTPDAKPVPVRTDWERALMPDHLASTLTAGLGAMAVAVAFLAPDLASTGYIFAGFIALTVALALFSAARNYATYPAIAAALAAIGGIRTVTFATASGTFVAPDAGNIATYVDPLLVSWVALGLGLFFAATGIALTLLRRGAQTPHAVIWSVLATATPLILATISFTMFGNYAFDLKHGLFAILLALAYLGAAEFAFRDRTDDGGYVFTRDLFLAASFAALVYALIVMTNGAATTIGAAVIGFVYLLGQRLRNWPVLPWAMVAAAIFVAGRIAWEPTIVGVDHLGTTPVFNALLAGYGIPSLLLIVSAWILRDNSDDRIRSVMQALASLFTLLTLGILVRHAMNGGVLNDAVPTLGEQAIYTLLTVGASATLMAIDLRRPSIVFRTGSMAVGYISMISVIAAHYVGLNPYFTGEMTGKIPFFNLLFLAYLLPGLAYGAAAWFARYRRPLHYVIALALTASSLLFAYVTLSVRRLFHGEGIADWKGFLQPELYTYSVVWLLLGVALLVIGYRLRAKSIRIASAVLVLIAVLKVFLIDMGNLEGLYQILSFIGLGVVLIGIGRFYQTILTGLAAEAPVTGEGSPTDTAADDPVPG